MVASLAALQASDPDYLAALISTASQAIRDACCRNLAVQTYTEYHSGGGYPYQLIQLRQFPVVSPGITRIATTPTGVLTVVNNSSANQRATVATGDDGLTLTRVASGVSSTSTLLYANYPTITTLAAAVTALGNGWTGTVQGSYGLWPSADLKPMQGAVNAISAGGGGGASLELYVEDVLPAAFAHDGFYGYGATGAGWRLDEETGQVFGLFPQGTMNLRVDYSAGYASIPDPIQQACAMLAAAIYEQAQRETGMTSERIGPYAATYSETVRQLVKSPAIATLIAPYRDPSKIFGRHP